MVSKVIKTRGDLTSQMKKIILSESGSLSEDLWEKIQKALASVLDISDFDNLCSNISPYLKNIVKKHKEDYIKYLKESIRNQRRIKELLADREEYPTTEVLKDISNNTTSDHLLKVVDIFLSNENLINNSTILRGKTPCGTGVGETSLEGIFTCVNPQVFVRAYNGTRHVRGFTFEPQSFEEYNREEFNITVLHELVHSFTRYIVAIFEKGQSENILFQAEKDFYNTANTLHKEFLEKHTTDEKYLNKLDEFIAKTITIPSEWAGLPYRDAMTKAFAKMYEINIRSIISLSKHLQKNI